MFDKPFGKIKNFTVYLIQSHDTTSASHKEKYFLLPYTVLYASEHFLIFCGW